MSALNQYLDLYSSNKDLLNSHSAGVLNTSRAAAAQVLRENGLPKFGSEHYAVTDLEKVLAPDYGVNMARVKIPVDTAASFHCDVPNMSTALFFLINDTFACGKRAADNLPEGVVVESLATAAVTHKEIVEKYYGKVADGANALVALNTLLTQDGVFIYVPKGVVVEKPIQLVNILQNNMPLMAVRRMLIVVEDDAEAQLLVCDHTQNAAVDFLALQTIEIVAGVNAKFSIYDLEESSEKTSRLSTLYLRQERNSDVMVDGITLFNGNTRNEYYCTFAGEGASLQLLGMGIEDKNRRLDTYSHISHPKPNCYSNELFKYVADDEAVCGFEGRIYVAEGAHGTNSYQANRNILASSEARIYSKPQLEIYNDDVKCSHGSAIGQLDETQIFYMRTRGVDIHQAKLLLKQAFMADVIEGVRLSSLKDRLKMLVEHRFLGDKSAGCGTCNAGCGNIQ
jgi:Fe-S cluster assembly protein SufD